MLTMATRRNWNISGIIFSSLFPTAASEVGLNRNQYFRGHYRFRAGKLEINPTLIDF